MSSIMSTVLSRATPEEIEMSPYGYVPTRYVTILFLALFSLSTSKLMGSLIVFSCAYLP